MNRTLSAIGGLLAILGSGAATAATLHPPEIFQKLIEKAKLIAYDANALLGKPNLKAPGAICRTRSTCAKYCSGENPIASKVREALKAKGREELVLVDPALAVQAEFRKLGCEPAGGDDLKVASENCGIRFLWGKDIRKVLPGVIPGLVRAALEAGARGYVLLVGSTHRDEVEQMRKVCRRIAQGREKVCGKDIACPGGSKHGSGYAIDVGLLKPGDKHSVTPMDGWAGKCKSAKAKVRAHRQLPALMEAMLSTGWWWYCQELWHFEYSVAPDDPATRVNTLEGLPAVTKGGATPTAKAAATKAAAPRGLLDKAKEKVGEWAEGAVDKVKGLAGSLLESRGYVSASSASMRAGPTKSADRVRILSRCAEVRLLGKKAGWVEVEAGGKRGFVWHALVAKERPAACK